MDESAVHAVSACIGQDQVKRSISIADRYYIMMYESVKTNSTNVFQRWLRAYGKAAQFPAAAPRRAAAGIAVH